MSQEPEDVTPGEDVSYRTTGDIFRAALLGFVALAFFSVAFGGGGDTGSDGGPGASVVSVVLGCVLLWFAYRAQRPKTASARVVTAQRKTAKRQGQQALKEVRKGNVGQASRRRAESGRLNASGDWEPTPPHLPLYSPDLPPGTTEVAGEFYHRESLEAIFGERTPTNPGTRPRLTTRAVLTCDPDNPFGGGHAVAVWIDNHHVGYIPGDLSRAWTSLLAPLEAKGQHLKVPARVSIAMRSNGDIVGSVVLLTDVTL